jgi:hypothetical protein
VDRRKDISEFLTSRRARLTPDQAGLASFGDRLPEFQQMIPGRACPPGFT